MSKAARKTEPEIVRRDGKIYKLVYLNRLPWDRLCEAIKWLKMHRPEYYAWLRDPGVIEIQRLFPGTEIPIEFEVQRK